MDDALELAKRNAGGASGLAAKLTRITPQAISQWRKVPAGRVLEVEAASGVSRHDLRPDIFGPAVAPAEGEAA